MGMKGAKAPQNSKSPRAQEAEMNKYAVRSTLVKETRKASFYRVEWSDGTTSIVSIPK
jgi:hypothetical protein